ncbi:MAG: DUF2892 domain-containing protein [Phreatobacter sp.]|uniref:YgaP family membrane protein n=1 Tax=Phreatobacter sp. TaxID=1966341 RepID=UPI001A62C8B1|nr:DUF2892 domain-containing protein [Phreatobacter sp.]MBL8569921.1 DUF2892 domain-containing protein [Phreatobacter sp.]
MAFYRKNIGSAQQVVRIAAGLAVGPAALWYLGGAAGYAGLAGGLMFAATGIVGYCPMCAVAGIGSNRDRA